MSPSSSQLIDTSERRDAERAEDARLVADLRRGDERAFGILYDRYFDRVWDLSRRILRDDERARETAQDTFLAAWQGLPGLQEPASFGGWLLRIARNRALNRVDHERRASPVEPVKMEAVAVRGAVEERAVNVDDPALVAEDAELAELIDEAAVALGPRDMSVLHLHLRDGLEPAELADELGVSRNAAKQVLHRTRNRLGDAIRARVLWRGGTPVCADLRDALAAAGITRFDADAVRTINEHAESCEDCATRRRTKLAPAVLFSGAPAGAAPLAWRYEMTAALADDGVPMRGSRYGRRARSRARKAVLVGSGIGIVLLVTAGVLVLDSDEASTPTIEAGPATTDEPSGSSRDRRTRPDPEPQVLAPPSVVPESSTTRPATGVAPDPAPDARGPGPPPPPPPPPPPVVNHFMLTPNAIVEGFGPDQVVLSWSVSGVGSVSASGPGLSSGSFTGNAPVCPPPVLPDFLCGGPAGEEYRYRLTVRDSQGAVVFQEALTLSIL